MYRTLPPKNSFGVRTTFQKVTKRSSKPRYIQTVVKTMPRKSSRGRKKTPSRVLEMLEEDEEIHHEIVNHDVYTHTVSSIEEDVAFRHSNIEQDVRRWHHEHELPVRKRGKSKSKKKNTKVAKESDLSSGKKKGRVPRSSVAKALRKQELPNENILAKEEKLKNSTRADSSRIQSFRGEFDDPILHLYMVLLIPALLYACVRYFLGGFTSL